MKRILFIFCSLFLLGNVTFAQKYAFVDTEYILEKIPAYETAKEELDALSKQYQEEVEQAFKEVEELYKKFQSESVLLSEDMKRRREDEIINKEKEAKELQRKYFGKEGELFNKRQELVQPIQDEIYNAVKEIAKQGNYAVIFDTAAGASLLFTDPKYDKSDEVLEKLGY